MIIPILSMKKPRLKEVRHMAYECHSKGDEGTSDRIKAGEEKGYNRYTLGDMLIETELRQVPDSKGNGQWEGGQEATRPYLAALTSDTAVVITGGLVPAHDTLLVFVQVARDIPWEGERGRGQWARGGAQWSGSYTVSTGLCLSPPAQHHGGRGSLSQSRKEKSWGCVRGGGGGDCPSLSLQIYIMEVVLLTVHSGTQPTSMYLFLSLDLTMFRRQALNPFKSSS